MATELRGGLGRIRRMTAANGMAITGSGDGVAIGCPVDAEYGTIGATNYIQISGVTVLTRMYFTQKAFDADVTLTATDGFIELPVGTGIVFEGPISLESEPVALVIGGRKQSQPLLFLRSTGADADAVILFYHRRS